MSNSNNQIPGWFSAVTGRLVTLFCLLLLASVLGLSPAARAQAPEPSAQFFRTVLIAGSDNTAFNLRFMDLLQNQLGSRVKVRTYTEAFSLSHPDLLVVALGSNALSQVQQQSPRPATLALMVDENQVAAYLGRERTTLSAIYHNPPLIRQALLGKLILPQGNQVALLVQAGEEARYDPLLEELARFELEARVFPVQGEDALIATLARALSFGDFLLAVPDSAIYNARTIKHILLTAYRRNRIVIGPGRAFVRAGVLASSYTSLETVTAIAAERVRQFLDDGSLAPPGHPERFEIDVNRQVARSLNIPVPDTDELAQGINALLQNDAGSDNP